MRNLSRVTTEIYENCYPTFDNYCNNPVALKSKLKYFEVPLIGDTYKIPLFVFPMFASLCKSTTEGNEMPQAMVAVLQTYGHSCYYKSIEAIMKDTLNSDYYSYKLYKIKLSNDIHYYGTKGAIFDEEFNPLCIYTWRMQRVIDGNDGRIKFQFIKPFLYISSSVYLDRNDAVQKFLSGRMINTILQDSIRPKYSNECNLTFIRDYNLNFTPDIMICEKIPFNVIATETPSISTTNEQLIKTVLKYKDDIWK